MKDQEVSPSCSTDARERVKVRRKEERCWLKSLFFRSLLSPTHLCLTANKKGEISQTVRWITARFRAHVLLRLERKRFWSYANEESSSCYKSNRHLDHCCLPSPLLPLPLSLSLFFPSLHLLPIFQKSHIQGRSVGVELRIWCFQEGDGRLDSSSRKINTDLWPEASPPTFNL